MVAGIQNGDLTIVIATELSGKTHEELLKSAASEATHPSGAFFIVNWETGEIEICGYSISLGGDLRPEYVEPVLSELRRIYADFALRLEVLESEGRLSEDCANA